jgi:two-component system, LuxR family, sensor kinase FixL
MKKTTRILMVDDDPAVLEFYSHFLRTEGYEVRGVATGREGLRAACEWRPELVLLDVMLPDLDGVEVCRQLKSHPALPDVFVVLFSGEATSVAHKVEGLETGADEYLVKSIQPDEFLARIRTMVRLQEATAALRASEQHYRLLVEILPEAVASVDLQARLISANPPAVAMLGYTEAATLLGKSLFDLMPPEEHKRLQDDIATTLRTGRLRDSQHTLLRLGGNGFPAELSATVSADRQGRPIGLVLVVRDIAERNRLEREVLEISATERRRIGHELHDGLGQYLAGIAFRAKALEQALAAEASPRSGEAQEIATLISNAIRQTRGLARGLDPIEVETSGLVASLQSLAAETNYFFNVNCCFRSVDSELRIAAPTGLALYRIAQEAIHNAITHGQARQIQIELVLDAGHLRLRLQDDGTGFEVERANRDGMGLRVMEYRARSIGANLTIRSQPGQGTEISCQVPGAA